MRTDFDLIVVGSGFGGSVAAHRLVEKGYKVAVIEMGRRWAAKRPPTTRQQRLDELEAHLRTLRRDAGRATVR